MSAAGMGMKKVEVEEEDQEMDAADVTDLLASSELVL